MKLQPIILFFQYAPACLHAENVPGVGSTGDLTDAARPASARPPH